VAQSLALTGRLATRTSLRRVLPQIDLGPLDLQTFGICFAAAFLASGGLLGRRLKELGRPPDWAYEAIFSALVGGLVGSRLDYMIQNWDKVSGDLFGSLFSGAGLVWFGGLVGGAAGVLLWAYRRGFMGAMLVDACAAPLALGYAVGRVGCQLSGDGDYGEPSSLPWAMSYPDGTVPTTQEVHPTPVYETLTMGLVAAVLWRLRDRFAPGGLFALYLVLAGLERFLVEFVRRNDAVVGGLTLPQLISLAMVAGGAAWLVAHRDRLSATAPEPAATSR
jgi:phosphatidylglycerol:prolipoprotein diacylglycerol transferase